MTGTDEVSDLDAVRSLLERCSLRAIEYHELSARITASQSEAEPGDPEMTLALQHRLTDDGFGIRMSATITVPFGEAQASVAAVYDCGGEMPSLRTILGFANEVAVMTLFPYVREVLSTLTGRVFGEPVLLPILPRGTIGFDLDEIAQSAE